jgi:hypothetical protein
MSAIPAILIASLCVFDGASARGSGGDAVVVVERLDVLDEPDETGFVTGQLQVGEQVHVMRREPSGWVAIAAPADAFDWIDSSSLTMLDDDRARVSAHSAAIRAGNANARLPGPPRRYLKRGTTVRLRERPVLTLPHRDSTHQWQAIDPLEGEVRYVRSSGLAQAGDLVESQRVRRRTSPVRSFDTSFRSLGPPASALNLPAEFKAALTRVEAQHRAILRQPLETWQLDEVKRSYQALLSDSLDPAGRSLVQSRLAQLRRQQAIAGSARRFTDLARESRGRDRNADGRLKEKESATANEAPFDAVGMLQASSKEIDGNRVFALIGEDGLTTAYLSMPPGVDTRRFLASRVGIRGQVRYSEPLRNRLIRVTEMESLVAAP